MTHNFGELTELHVHVGSSVDPPIMWEIAHMQGIKLPTKNYWEFEDLIAVSGITTYQKYLDLFHWTELIQSSPEAMEKSVYSIISGAYRKCNITTVEIRFNPMLRNRGGERDLDHIILSAIHGMEKAMLAFPVKAGLILMFHRTYPQKLNEIIAKKAIKYKNHGVVGVDIGGPIDKNFKMNSIKDMVLNCKKEGLGVTIHTGEATDACEVMEVLNLLNPDRIGHGIRSIEDENVLKELASRGVVLEVCPTSNVHTSVVKNLNDFKLIFSKLKEFNVPFTINTDGPEMLKTNLVKEYELLLENNILTKEDLEKCTEVARKATFIK
ncbi:hypothetical protein A3D77_04840 [Candidatus Gottesmanbacteria bacterium RIFCSPHIGHO2_02_FULL_39_11]|uniref:adenosine deaminase n=1 Tax=Candidatus Gottesmanbacteria bacterium RIFCSPHIGHO2_02_FULL_39_11 TaxID=1798382 RepID=A0A1F5ZLM4_9BACT|nr:MAG: hypothetical protein A3D77_04840 [Candidatus Gottesmanbacteria bacterium RIFCSPHIGHO2_02_FULL_39_11]